MSSAALQPPQRPYTSGHRPIASASLDSFVDFDSNNENYRAPHHKKGFSSPLSLFRNRKKSSGDTRDKPPPVASNRQLTNVRSAESLNHDHDLSKTSQLRALPPLPRSQSANVPSTSSPGPQGIYAPLRMSPEGSTKEFSINDINGSRKPQVNPRYDGLPYNQTSSPLPPLHANRGPPVVYPTPPPQQSQPENAIDSVLQKDGQAFLDENRMLDRDVAPDLFLAEGLSLAAPSVHHKQAIESIKKVTLGGAKHLKAAEEALDAFTASPVWTEGKDIAETLIEPAKDMVEIFDIITPYVPMLIVAKTVFVVLVQKEMDRKSNEQNMKLGLLTITKFWYTLCDVNVVFGLDPQSKSYIDLHELVKTVVDKMHEFGNFQNVYYKHGHVARAMRATRYKTEIQAFLDAFKDFKDQLQRLLTQVSALTINDMHKETEEVDRKLDLVMEMLLHTQSSTEARIQEKIQAYGGEESAFQSKSFVNEITESEFKIKATPQLRSILHEDLSVQLKANEAMFKLQLQEATRDLQHTMAQNTEAVLAKLDSGPHELIRDKDIRQIWKGLSFFYDSFKSKNFLLTHLQICCKTRHFVDALHHYFAQQYAEHRKKTGEPHPDQWTLKFTGRVVFQPTIGDAFDSDGSGYVSIDEVNRFTVHLPRDSINGQAWSIPVFLAHAAAGWYQNALHYRLQCIKSLRIIEQYAKKTLPLNRRHLKQYFQNGCLPEIWYIVDSLNTDAFRYQQEDLRSQFEILAKYRHSIMQMLHDHLQANLNTVRFRLEGPEDVRAVMGTSRCEAVVLPLLTILLERHARIVQTATTLVLAEREFQDMTTCLQSVAHAFSRRYSVLTEGWKQQRFDVPLQVACFSYGIFVNWHTHFQSAPYDQLYPGLHTEYESEAEDSNQAEAHGPEPAKDLLTYSLPVQPSAEEVWNRKLTFKTRSIKRDDTRKRERYAVEALESLEYEPSQVRIDGDIHRLLDPSTNSPTHHRRPNSSLSSYQFEFDDPEGVLRAMNDGYASAESSEIPDISYTKGKILTMDDRIQSVEEELNSMKNMLAQLLALSKQQIQ
ncbi:hypothetical protein D9757_003997 [Collybiopsis confluens]|uniref:EF-hand domain-containing protein n=1 Tax=Collybiopsis confluens TaxID=2823264 RepID=A0A8H5HX42_9AGAR|nr:hypothetical protein D9757_003997 [Collybiopsis confluens]